MSRLILRFPLLSLSLSLSVAHSLARHLCLAFFPFCISCCILSEPSGSSDLPRGAVYFAAVACRSVATHPPLRHQPLAGTAIQRLVCVFIQIATSRLFQRHRVLALHLFHFSIPFALWEQAALFAILLAVLVTHRSALALPFFFRDFFFCLLCRTHRVKHPYKAGCKENLTRIHGMSIELELYSSIPKKERLALFLLSLSLFPFRISTTSEALRGLLVSILRLLHYF
jgi:hypothetical protein